MNKKKYLFIYTLIIINTSIYPQKIIHFGIKSSISTSVYSQKTISEYAYGPFYGFQSDHYISMGKTSRTKNSSLTAHNIKLFLEFKINKSDEKLRKFKESAVIEFHFIDKIHNERTIQYWYSYLDAKLLDKKTTLQENNDSYLSIPFLIKLTREKPSTGYFFIFGMKYDIPLKGTENRNQLDIGFTAGLGIDSIKIFPFYTSTEFRFSFDLYEIATKKYKSNMYFDFSLGIGL